MEPDGALPLSLFPNPSEDAFTLRVMGMATEATNVEICDMRGAIVHSAVYPPTGEGITISGRAFGLADGIYVLRASNDLGSAAAKLVLGR